MQDRGNQIGDSLADTGPGLYEQMLFVEHSISDSLSHPHLLLSMLVTLTQLGKSPTRAQQLSNTLLHNKSILGEHVFGSQLNSALL